MLAGEIFFLEFLNFFSKYMFSGLFEKSGEPSFGAPQRAGLLQVLL